MNKILFFSGENEVLNIKFWKNSFDFYFTTHHETQKERSNMHKRTKQKVFWVRNWNQNVFLNAATSYLGTISDKHTFAQLVHHYSAFQSRFLDVNYGWRKAVSEFSGDPH